MLDIENEIKHRFYPFFVKFLSSYFSEFKNATKGCNSLLDVGCGANSPVQFLENNLYTEGVDLYYPSIVKSRKMKIHNAYHLVNVLDIDKKFKPKSFDCVIALELIEHLPKKDGLKLIKKMEKIARKRVIIGTPNGFLPQKEYDKNKLQIHLSGWTAKEMKKLGFKVIGVGGYKSLKGERGDIVLKPFFFWKPISVLSEFIVKNRPEKAFQIMCIKELG